MLDKLFRSKPSSTNNTGAKPDDLKPVPDRASDQVILYAPDSAPDSAPGSASGGASASVTVSLSGREVANENELETLKALHKFGWLTSRQVAEWVWPNCSQSVQMARRTLNRLDKLGQLLTGNLPNGVRIYALSASGADRLRSQGVRARSGKDIGLRRWQHRAICNWHGILLHGYGYEIDTEHELYAERGQITQWYGKLADVIGYSNGRFRWVEVEHSRRKPSDLRKLLHLLMHGPTHPQYAHDMSLECIELVTTDMRLVRAIAGALQRKIHQDGIPHEDRRRIWTSIVVTELRISPGLILTDHSTWAISLSHFLSDDTSLDDPLALTAQTSITDS